jgi:hypothetical protein
MYINVLHECVDIDVLALQIHLSAMAYATYARTQPINSPHLGVKSVTKTIREKLNFTYFLCDPFRLSGHPIGR